MTQAFFGHTGRDGRGLARIGAVPPAISTPLAERVKVIHGSPSGTDAKLSTLKTQSTHVRGSSPSGDPSAMVRKSSCRVVVASDLRHGRCQQRDASSREETTVERNRLSNASRCEYTQKGPRERLGRGSQRTGPQLEKEPPFPTPNLKRQGFAPRRPIRPAGRPK